MGNDSLRIEGFVQIELVNKNNKVKRVYHNTITNAGKKLMLDKSAGHMLQVSADAHGRMMAMGNIATMAVNSYDGYTGKLASNKRGLTNVLLNLGSSAQSGLTASTTYLNIWDNTLSSRSKLIGYANNAIVTPSGDTKQGVIDACKGEYCIAGDTIAKRWYYPAGVASGTIDTICMMGADAVASYKGEMLGVMKCLDKTNNQASDYVNNSTGFLIPGVPGYTANDEIMLDYNGGRWKFNLTTGEMTTVAAEDPFFVFVNPNSTANGCCDMRVIGNYLYVLYFHGNGGQYEVKMDVYDIQNSMNRVGRYSQFIGSQWDSYYIRSCKFLKVGSDYFVSVIRYNSNTSVLSQVKAVKLGGNNNWMTFDSTYNDYTYFSGLTVPSGLPGGIVGFSDWGANYIMWMGAGDITNEVCEYNNAIVGLVFTDPSDPAGSIIDGVYCQDMSVLFSAGTNQGVLGISYRINNSSMIGGNWYSTDNEDGKVRLFSNASSSGANYDLYSSGLFLSMWGWWSNVLSFVKLNEAISKGDEDEMYVSYGYRVV